MEIKFDVTYAQDVVEKDIPKLDAKSKILIKTAIENKLIKHPEIFGKPLKNSLSGYRKLRVGDYRVIFEISKNKIIIWMIEHRKKYINILSKD